MRPNKIPFTMVDSVKKDTGKKSAINVEFKALVSNSPMQFGDHNTQNNQFGEKTRHVDDALKLYIKDRIPEKSLSIRFALNRSNSESMTYANEIEEYLTKNGYKIYPSDIDWVDMGWLNKVEIKPPTKQGDGYLLIIYPKINKQ